MIIKGVEYTTEQLIETCEWFIEDCEWIIEKPIIVTKGEKE